MDRRYDAIYQRGHQPTEPPQPSVPPQGTTQPSPPQRGTGQAPSRSDAAGPAPAGPAPGNAPAGPSAEPAGVEVAQVTPDGRRVPDRPPAAPEQRERANPYVRLLVIVGALLLAAGAAAIFIGGGLMNMMNRGMSAISMEEQEQYYSMIVYGQLLTTLGPFLVVIGLGTLIGVAFLKAQGWQTAHRSGRS